MPKPILTKAVCVATGEVAEVVIGEGERVWRKEHLKKDGGIPLNRLSDGYMAAPKGGLCLQDFVFFDAGRETQADILRRQIRGLREQIEETEQNLLELYKGG